MQVVTTSSSLLRRFPVSFKPHKKPRRLQLLTCELDNAVAATAATRIISENANQNQNENTLQRDALLMIAYMKNTRSSKKKVHTRDRLESGESAIKHVHIKNGLHPGIPK